VAPRRHLTLQVLLCALAVAGGLLGLRARPAVVLTAGTPAGHVAALRVVVDLPSPHQATRDLYATGCGLATRYCVLRSSTRPRDLVDDVVELLLDKGATRVDGHCSHERRVEALECHQRLELDGVGILVTAGNEVGPGTPVPTYATVLVVGEAAGQSRAAAPLASLALLGLVPEGMGTAPCVLKRGAGCAEYRGAYTTTGTTEGLTASWRARLSGQGYRLDVDRCDDNGCQLVASRFRTFGGQDPMLVTLSLTPGGAGQVVQRLVVAVPAPSPP
jgi:hypothetical protein